MPITLSYISFKILGFINGYIWQSKHFGYPSQVTQHEKNKKKYVTSFDI